MMNHESVAWSSYLVGTLIDLLSIATLYFSNKPLSVSTAYARSAGLVGNLFSKEHTENLKFYQDRNPKIEWGERLVFGFSLQIGGVGKYEVLMGQFLLTDFTIIKSMRTAIIVGMLGIFTLRALGLVKLHLKPTRYAANIAGGLLFGVGLGLFGYCPRTGVVAPGQGNYDGIAGILGLIVLAQLSP